MFSLSYSASWCSRSFFFFFNDTATTEIYTLSLHDALPIFPCNSVAASFRSQPPSVAANPDTSRCLRTRSEEHTSELQSLAYLVCRLLLEKKKARRREISRFMSNGPSASGEVINRTIRLAIV